MKLRLKKREKEAKSDTKVKVTVSKRVPAKSSSIDEALGAETVVNKFGDKRGLHNKENPPSSEQMKRIRQMRKFYNKQMPNLACNNCAFSSSCPQFRAGYECAFLPFLNSHKIESTEDLVGSMKELLAANMRRAHLATIMETLTGGMPSQELSESLNLLFTQLSTLHERMTEIGSVEIETNDSSIIGRLFGGIDTLIDQTKDAIDNPVDAIPVSTIDKDRVDAEVDGEQVHLPPKEKEANEDLLKDMSMHLNKVQGKDGEIVQSEIVV